jgi:hypothetical protein
VQAALDYFIVRHTIGVAHVGWHPGIEQPQVEQCVVCGSVVDDPLGVCLACSRSGLDGWIPYPDRQERPKACTHGRFKGGLDNHYVRGASRPRRRRTG